MDSKQVYLESLPNCLATYRQPVAEMTIFPAQVTLWFTFTGCSYYRDQKGQQERFLGWPWKNFLSVSRKLGANKRTQFHLRKSFKEDSLRRKAVYSSYVMERAEMVRQDAWDMGLCGGYSI